MTVKVIRGRVDTGVRVYNVGEIITGLGTDDEHDLVAKGSCEWAIVEPGQQQQEQNDHSGDDDSGLPDGVVKLTGGFFSLPDGSKVRGKAKALERLAELAAADDGGKKTPADGEGGEKGPNTAIPGLT
jgi:hypothetical protein